jgi:hypothetical protein
MIAPLTAMVLCLAAAGCGDSPSVSADTGRDGADDLAQDVGEDESADLGDLAEPDAGDMTTDPRDADDDGGPDAVDGGDAGDAADASGDDGDLAPDLGGADLDGDTDGGDAQVLDIASDADADTDRLVTFHSVSAVESPTNVLAAYIDWETSVAAPASLVVTCDGEPVADLTTPRRSTAHSAFVMGLIPGATCEVRLGAGVGWVFEEEVFSYEVSDLPADFPTFDLLVPTALDDEDAWDAVAPGWTLFNLTRVGSSAPLIVAMVDERGRFRWYNRRATGAGADTDVRTVPEGVLIGGALGAGGRVFPAIVDWEGQVVWEDSLATHHHMGVDPATGELLYLSQTVACPERVRADVVNRYDRTLREVTWSWSACEHYEPPVLYNDWTHMNAIEPLADEDAYLISVRNQHSLFKIDLESGDIVWRLGWNGDFAMAPEDAFYMQHSPEQQSDGTLLLFDNGLENRGQPFAYDIESRTWSRVVQIAYDEEEMTAEVVWEYRPETDIFSNIQGDADRQPNGNVLTVFTAWTGARGTDYIEVTADADPTEVWWLRGTPGWASYRAERVGEPPQGYFIAPGDSDGD